MKENIMKNKLFKIFVFLTPLISLLTSCSDFRKAVGKEKVIPDEFSVASTPSLIIPPGYKIDPNALLNANKKENNDNFNLSEEIQINNNNEVNSFVEIFNPKNISADIRKIVDEETLGISLSERRGIDILFGNVPKSGVAIDTKKEEIRIRQSKSLNKKINSTPSPGININSGKPILIK